MAERVQRYEAHGTRRFTQQQALSAYATSRAGLRGARRDSDDDQSAPYDPQADMVARQKDAWKARRSDRLGPLGRRFNDPEPGNFGSSSRATHGGGQNAINAAAYEPDEPTGLGHGEGALMGETEGAGFGGFAGAEGMADDEDDGGSVEDSMARMVDRQRAAWRTPKRDRADVAPEQAWDPDDGGRAAMQARQAAAWDRPRRVPQVQR